MSAIGGVAIAVLLAACSAGAPEEPPEPAAGGTGESADEQTATPDSSNAAAGSQGAATVSIDGRTFEFDLRMCSVYDGGEALISGSGSEVGSDVPSHLDGDSVSYEHGEFRIDIGADGPFVSTEDFLTIGSAIGDNFSLVEDGSGYVVTGQAWSGTTLDLGVGTLQFNCN